MLKITKRSFTADVQQKRSLERTRTRPVRVAENLGFGPAPKMVSFSIEILIQIEPFQPPASRGPFGAVFGPRELETDPDNTKPKTMTIKTMQMR